MKELPKTGAVWAGKPCCFYEEIDSTNEEAKRLSRKGAGHGTLVWARRQTAGKGRRGRSWASPADENIYMSLLLKPDFEPDKASMITLAAAMAVGDGIKKSCGLETAVKWPNDIVAEGKKLCGILTELEVENGKIFHLVVGIGINVFQTVFPEELKEKAISIKGAGGKTVPPEEIVHSVMEAFEGYYESLCKEGDLRGFLPRYNARLANRGRLVTVLDPKGNFRGQALGIDSYGRLLVKAEDGSIRKVFSGEVSVRGIYGYL